jgi:hypothetical protein
MKELVKTCKLLCVFVDEEQANYALNKLEDLVPLHDLNADLVDKLRDCVVSLPSLLPVIEDLSHSLGDAIKHAQSYGWEDEAEDIQEVCDVLVESRKRVHRAISQKRKWLTTDLVASHNRLRKVGIDPKALRVRDNDKFNTIDWVNMIAKADMAGLKQDADNVLLSDHVFWQLDSEDYEDLDYNIREAS